MASKSLRILIIFSSFIFCLTYTTSAQTSADLNKLKSGQISDAQLLQYVQQAQSSGMSEADIIQELQKRGIPESDIQALVTRIKSMSGNNLPSTELLAPSSQQNIKRFYKGDLNIFKPVQVVSRVFGSELFTSADPVFIPNIKIATPKNYILGPEDELQLDVYGNNVSNQKLIVSPDGYVNVKYAGLINVGGLSIEQANGIIKSRLIKFYPAISTGATKVQLTLGAIRSIQVTIVGAVRKPGTVTLPSISTLFNALYASGGPLDNGSFRNIELVRTGKIIAVADLYDFLLRGEQTGNITLHDNDIIRVPYVQSQVILDGGLNRTGIFEFKLSETLQQMLNYAGGFKSNSFKGRITGTRFTDIEKKVIDISKADFNNFKLSHGDSLYVDSVVDKFENRVIITGAVFKPGMYSLEPGMDLKLLITKAQGLKDEAFQGRANIVRTREDLTKEYASVDLKQVLNEVEKFMLRKEDSINVVSVLDLKDKRTILINGPVKKEGEYPYEDSLSLQSLILQAGGFKDIATASGIEVGRRKKGIDVSSKGAITAQIIKVPMTKDLSKLGADFYLEPFDVVSIKTDPSNLKQIAVKISGEVLYKGVYTLETPEERLSSVVKRAGGLLPYADINGAKLIRQKINVDTAQLKRLALSSVKISDLKSDKKDTSELISNDELKSQTTEVALDLNKIMEKPGSQEDLILQDGDELIVPKYNNTVSVGGEVLKPVTVQFEEGKGFGYYLSAAGGFTKNANKGRAFIVYANGRSARTHNYLGFRSFPEVRPGSSIFIPIKAEGKGFEPAKAGVFISAVTALSTVFVLLFK